jgi:hypothetical protein
MERLAAFEAGQADSSERGRDSGVNFGFREAHVDGSEGDVVVDRRAEKLVIGVLEDKADGGPDTADVLAGHREASDGNGPRGGLVDAVEMEHQRGFSGTVGTHQRNLIAFCKIQGNPAQGNMPVGIFEFKVPHLQEVACKGSM